MTGPVVFLDSGIGGIPYCKDFIRRNPAEPVVYLADCKNFPYGKKKASDLVLILTELVEKLISLFNPKMAVLACNTATVSALCELRNAFPSLPFVGTVPAIKPAIQASRKKIIGVLGTERTIEDPYIDELAQQFGPCKIHGIAAPDLVEFVETKNDSATPAEKTAMALPYLQRFRGLGADAIVLGCTHFLFLREEFCASAAPDIHVFDSLDGITGRIEYLLDKNSGALRAPAGSAVFKKMIVTGNESASSVWQNRARDMGFEMASISVKSKEIIR